jgi:hypothetical protein
VTLTPGANLPYGTAHTFTLTTAITDTAGNHLVENFGWSFTTESDPATTPPIVIATYPVNNALNFPAAEPVTATFSKVMDPATLTPASFFLNNGATGAVTYVDSTATLTPDDTLLFNTAYTATITTAVTDTFGNHLPANFAWDFTTGDDPLIPTASMQWPPDRAIIGDTVTIAVGTSHPIGVDSVRFFVDGLRVGYDPDPPFQFLWDASARPPGSQHSVYAAAYDAGGREGISDTITVHHLWELLAAEDDPGMPQDIRKVFFRSTDTLLEFRFEFLVEWSDPINDTALDLAVYFDVDRNPATGRTTLGDGTQLNDVGAEYRVIIGLHGLDAFAVWSGSSWDVLYDPNGFAYLNLLPDTSMLEFGFPWSDLTGPAEVNLLCLNAFYPDPENPIFDWVPNEGTGHLSIRREDRFLGVSHTPGPAPKLHRPAGQTPVGKNPF